MKERPDHLVTKFLNNELTPSEEAQLLEWMESPGGRVFLKKEVQLKHLILESLHRFDAAGAYGLLQNRIHHREHHGIHRLRPLLKYAAVLLILLSCGYLWYTAGREENQLLITGDREIVLELDNGNSTTIVPGQNQQIRTGEKLTGIVQAGDTLVYEAGTDAADTGFNTLHVPYGKTFVLKLTDGTTVNLNAGSSLRFPLRFSAGSRDVFLEGEAFFGVSENSDVPFRVHTGNITVKVTGTEFNVTAYKDEGRTAVVLCRGGVTLYKGETVTGYVSPVHLSPGELGAFGKHDGEFAVRKVDVTAYTAWTQGKMVFEGQTFAGVLKLLERRYDVKIENHYPALNGERFKGTFGSETVEEILQTFTESRLFSYEIRNNTIIIEKPEMTP